MFLHAKNRVARLAALNEELADLLDVARYQGRSDDCRRIAERRLQVRRALLLAGEFEAGETTRPRVTVSDVLARYG